MKHISVCICTFKRPMLLKRLLSELDLQVTEGEFSYSIVVSDNDHAQSAGDVVREFAAESSIPVTYCSESRQNIALARNKALEGCRGEFVAFIDDDEIPVKDWLCNLFKVCTANGVAGVLGPVKPYFEEIPPPWVLKGRFFERPTHETGYRVTLSEARTGNVLLRREMFDGAVEVFRQEFGTGGEDVDFFGRMMKKGHVFLWCNEAIVNELVPSSRCKRSYLLKRALLRGKNTFEQGDGRKKNLVKSVIAVPVYAVSLPLLLILGEHHFLKYLIKLCDHVGRLLALVRLNPIRVRDI